MYSMVYVTYLQVKRGIVSNVHAFTALLKCSSILVCFNELQHDCIAKSVICQSCIIWIGSMLIYPAAHHLQLSGTFVSILHSS